MSTKLLDYRNYFDFNSHNDTESKGFLHLLSFLNTPRSGSAQNSAGISFQTFITSVMISLIFCAFQTSVFSLLRCKLTDIYQPCCHYVDEEDKVAPLEEGFFSWIFPTFMEPLNSYLRLGLDAYFFIRFLCLLLTLFGGLALINIPVLIPVNYSSGYDHYKPSDLLKYTNGTIPNLATGLDKISMSNIAPLFSRRLSIHLTMTVISIIWFHGLVIIELLNYAKIKNSYLKDQAEQSQRLGAIRSHSNVILIDNVPLNLLGNEKELLNLFSKVSGNRVKNIWFVYNYKKLKHYYKRSVKLRDQIEALETNIICSNLFEAGCDSIDDKLKYHHNKRLFYFRRIGDLRIGLKYYVIPVLYLQNNHTTLNKVAEDFVLNRHAISEERNLLLNRTRSPMQDIKYNKVFIQFEDSFQHYMFNQIQISDKLNELNNTLIFVDPKDLIWENLSVQSNAQVFIRVIVSNCLSVMIILGWVIPVAFIGLVSQLPYLTTLIPFLSWLKYLPEYITDVISNFISMILLICLSETVPHIFRWLSYVKCKKTGAQVELDVQNWMFVFLFIHLFMVVTISSGLTVIVESLINNPVLIPNILATNLPKCSNFFFSYLVIRGTSYFANNLLQSVQLIKHFVFYSFKDITPRRKFNRLTTLPKYKWGSIYSTFAVLGSIGLIYCILSPLILVFCCCSFLLILISFKYSLRYQFNIKNASENYGQFYPVAIFHLYSGIYFMEICLIGIFVLSKDEKNQTNCIGHALITFVLLILTAAGQIQIKKMFVKLLSKNMPLTLYEPKPKEAKSVNVKPKNDLDQDEVMLSEDASNSIDIVKSRGNDQSVSDEPRDTQDFPSENLFNDTFHHACFQHSNSVIWIPRDSVGYADKEIAVLKSFNIKDVTCEYAELTNNGEVVIHGFPPDFTG